VRSFRVGGGLVVVNNQLLLTANRRRQGTLEWTPPGGVIDHGESVIDAISREVREETGLQVDDWEGCHYVVNVTAPDMGWELTVEAWLASSAGGDIIVNDPDGIVEQAEFVEFGEVAGLVETSPLWVRLPLLSWLDIGMQPMEAHHFRVFGADRDTARVEQWLP
jgi:8-oxo-dGTP diphosphatase